MARLFLILSTLVFVGLVPSKAAELIMFEQRGCHWCEQWDEDIGVVYFKTTEGKRAPLRRVDIHEKTPDDLKNVASGRFTPTFVLVEDGKEIGRIRGYPGESFFWSLLNQMISKLPQKTG
jgi:thioredoxin-related protein